MRSLPFGVLPPGILYRPSCLDFPKVDRRIERAEQGALDDELACHKALGVFHNIAALFDVAEVADVAADVLIVHDEIEAWIAAQIGDGLGMSEQAKLAPAARLQHRREALAVDHCGP